MEPQSGLSLLVELLLERIKPELQGCGLLLFYHKPLLCGNQRVFHFPCSFS